jgi:hypothetical protein
MIKANNTSCTTASTLTNNKISREILRNKQLTSITNGTSGCLYVTNVNLYLHPNANQTTTPDVGILEKGIKQIKTRCCNSQCFYYDPCIIDDYFYCCNPVCSCFKPDWYCYL